MVATEYWHQTGESLKCLGWPISDLRSWLDHGVAVEVDRCLREQASVDRRPGPQGNRRLAQDDPITVRCRANIHETGDLPEDILGKRPACQKDLGPIANGKILSDLEDPDSRRSAGKCDIGRDQEPGAPFVDPGGEVHASDVAGAQFGHVWRAPRSVGECKLHVGDGRGQGGRCRRRVVGRIRLPGYLWRGREHSRGIGNQRESGNVGSGRGADTNVSYNRRGRHRGYAALGEDCIVFRSSKIHRNLRNHGTSIASTSRAAGSQRTAGTYRTAGTIRAAGTNRTAGTHRTANTYRTANSNRSAGTHRTAGTYRATGTQHPTASAQPTTSTHRTAGSRRTTSTHSTAGSRRTTSTHRTASTEPTASTHRTAGSRRTTGTHRTTSPHRTAACSHTNITCGATRASLAAVGRTSGCSHSTTSGGEQEQHQGGRRFQSIRI